MQKYWKLKTFWRQCLKTHGDQSKFDEHVLRCIEQEVCNISNKSTNLTTKIKDWCLGIDPPRCIAADCESKKVHVRYANCKQNQPADPQW